MRSLRTFTASLVLLASAGAAAQDGALLRLQVDEPRAFGYQVGDTATRTVTIDVPRGLALDEGSLPQIGRQGTALELRTLQRAARATATGTRLSLALEYQIFAAPPAVRAYELPTLRLRFDGRPRAEELRVEAWPVVVAPLMPETAMTRTGLGELRPDSPSLPRDARTERAVLGASGALALLLGAYLALVYLGLPWWGARTRPFTRAYRALRAQRGAAAASPRAWQDACRALHAAFDETAGRVLFADAVDGFVARAPRYAALRDDIVAFYARSQAAFFAPGAPPADASERAWLLAFARACRDAERGSA